MKVEEVNGITVIVPELRQIDMNNSPKFRKDLEECLKDRTRVILNLGNVNFMDSTGLGIIVAALRNMNQIKGRMILCEASKAVKVLFEMVRLSHITNVYKDLDEALEAMKN